MDMPEVRKCCGMFPPKHGTYLISLYGLASGGLGIATIILFGIAENAIMSHFSNNQLADEIKKTFLMFVGLSSLMLFVASGVIFVGVTTKSPGALSTGYLIIFIMCLILMLSAMAAPMACFFYESTCLIKRVSSITIFLFIVTLTGYLEVWLYFMTVVWNHEQELGG
ncbi:hypothetical protein ABMA28_000439 [Loxostege sticticalis]|uniref:Uncharacterized protein n=1 Tax=Loxostege sticticalis TaxID=481309 RepID=A0ABD0TS92_LOXSC